MHQLLQSRIGAYVENSTNARAAEFVRVLRQLIVLIKFCDPKLGAYMHFSAGEKTLQRHSRAFGGWNSASSLLMLSPVLLTWSDLSQLP
jgi:hypothetical protein